MRQEPERDNFPLESADLTVAAPGDAAALRSHLRDLVALFALPAMWSGWDAARVVEALLDVLSSMLRLDLAYIRATDQAGSRSLEAARVEGRPDLGSHPREIAGLFVRWLTEGKRRPTFTLPHPSTGELLHATQIALSLEGYSGVVFVASRRSGFPTSRELFLLQSAVTQAEIALHNAVLMTALHQSLQREQAARADAEAATRAKDELNEELELRVVERTRQLRNSEERWRAVFENSAVGIALGDLGGRFLAANSAYQRMLGYSEEELRALSFIDITHEDDREDNWRLFTGLLKEQEQYFVLEKRYRRKDGNLIWVNIHVSLVPGTVSIDRFSLALVEDITERKRAEEALGRLNRTLQTLYQCNQALVHATEEYELLQSVCRILVEVGGLRMAWVGYREVDAKKTVRPVARAGYEDGYLERVSITWADTERGQGPAGTAIRTVRACWTKNIQTDPSMAPWRAEALKRGYASSISLPLISGGAAFGALTLYADEPNTFNERTLEQFTELANNLAYGVMALRTRDERRKAEEALQAMRAELAHVTRVTTMGELAASLAHELNQPLAAVVTNGGACLRWLGRDPPNLDEAAEAVRRIMRDATRASDVIAHTRALLKKSGGEKIPLDIRELIREVLVLVHQEVRRHRVLLQEFLAEDLPPVLGARVQLQQVALNLIMNGVEAMADVADESRELVIRAQRHEFDDGPGVLVAVRDAGIGLAEENLHLLFEAFYTTKSHGLGMGLSISRSIIEAHGGRLWATPNAGHGATFQFVLPALGHPVS